MPMPQKPTPRKFCIYCGKLLIRQRERDGDLESLLHFGRRKYCDRVCFAKALDAKPSASTGWTMTHYHARKLVPPGKCEICKVRKGGDVHHRDGDHTNNDRGNLQRVCRGCHTRLHRVRSVCSICGQPAKGHGYCNKHYIRWKKFGDPLMLRGRRDSK
jgi:hypothetical protein